MKLTAQTPKQSLNKAFLKQRPVRSEIKTFKENLKILLSKVQTKESEENKKNHVRDFLLDTYYKGRNEVNTKDRKDLVIHLDKTNESKVGVIIEAKTPESADMVRLNKLNTKAFHELVLYYFDERHAKDNIELKNLVVTNIYQWFIFDANVFDKQIYRNTKIKKLYETKINDKKDNPFFYEELRKILENLDEEITCTHFDLKDYQTFLDNEDLEDDKNLIELYKILSPYHLLKEPFADDSNALNKPFYDELLHIIGLEEVKIKSKSIIRRKEEGNRDQGSLLENAITMLKSKDSLRKVKDIANYGETSEERYFNVALELCLIWINRILFLKLLEAQLVSYHKGNREYRFLNIETINEFDELYTLFHDVLAKTLETRNEFIKEKYKRVPYLNSSLFEPSELEDQTITIESLKDSATLDFNKTTILKKYRAENKTFTTLEYLFKFLDAYDFASEGAEDVQEDNRSLINASVLGKVFEKINGYKDGSIFTPGFITMYMCRQAIRLAVVQKFKGKYELDIDCFDELRNFTKSTYKTEQIREYNALINSLHLCDPAVGSGHFLVSSLNEIIAVKSELGLFADDGGVRLSEYQITIENDELIITDENGDIFQYQINENGKPTAKAQRLQKTLFHEKQTLIENCLFGVDINPNSVKICRLRLWIELLKNAYYKESANFAELETLPNIDINIKEGNSLLSRFALDADLKQILKQIKYSIEDYRNFVLGYKETRDREKKREFEAKIKQIKDEFKTQLFFFSPERRKLADLENQLKASEGKQYLFGETDAEKAARFKDEDALKAKITKAKETVKQVEENAIYKNAFEWRFEFPEVLDDDGNFTGFDIVIGNPPYIAGKDLSVEFKKYLKANYQFSVGKFDLYISFIEKGLAIQKDKKNFCFIIPNTILANENAHKLRQYLFDNSLLDTVVSIGETVFDEAFVENVIIEINDLSKRDNFQILNKEFDLIRSINFEQILSENDNRIQITFNEIDERIIQNVYSNSILLGEVLDFCIGIQIGGHGNSEDFKTKYISLEKKSDDYKKMIDGKDFEPFSVNWSGKYVKYGDWLHRKRDSKYFLNPKILIRQIGITPVSTIDYEKFYTLNTVYNGILITNNLDLNYIFALINSKLIKFIWLRKFHDSKTLFPKIKKSQLIEIPIKKIEEKDQQPFVALVDQILELKKAGKDTQELENEIDRHVYRLYDLTDEEIAIVEGKD